MTSVSVQNLFKSYNGHAAVKDLSFSVSPGEILGLIGPNGAGKSSTIKIILDLMQPDSGEVELFDQPMQEETKNRIGYLPEEKGLYKGLSAIDCILYLSSLKGLDRSTAKTRAEEMLQEAGLLDSKKKKIKHMSKGMGQVIQFIVTVIHDPELIILDEPFSGLDPVNTEIMKNMLGDLRDEGKAVILSTHEMNEVEELCDRVLMIHHGSEVLYGDLQEIKSRYKKHSVQVNVEGEIGDLPGVIEKKPGKSSVELVLARDATPQAVLDGLRERGTIVNRFEVTTPSLNEIFLSIAGGNHE